jgi:hypothetical protein
MWQLPGLSHTILEALISRRMEVLHMQRTTGLSANSRQHGLVELQLLRFLDSNCEWTYQMDASTVANVQ